MRIKRRSNLNADEKLALTAWDDDIFQSDALNLIGRPKELHLVLYAENAPVSKCGLVKQQVLVGEENIVVGGIGGVVALIISAYYHSPARPGKSFPPLLSVALALVKPS